MRSKPGARGGASNHHGPVTGQIKADTKKKKTDKHCSVSTGSMEIKKHLVTEQKRHNIQTA